jgi:hypothetical protein
MPSFTITNITRDWVLFRPDLPLSPHPPPQPPPLLEKPVPRHKDRPPIPFKDLFRRLDPIEHVDPLTVIHSLKIEF